jgi:long-chain fatty acid transport protein
MSKKLITIHSLGLMIAFSSFVAGNAIAAGYQVWEQNAGGVGDYHAGGAAESDDATTTYYNPAGLVRIKKSQVVMGITGVDTNIRYKGTINDDTMYPSNLGYVEPQGGSFAAIPNFNMAVPINPKTVLGFSVVTPFGAQTMYDASSLLRYASTKTTLKTIDIGPSLGISLTDQLSVGTGIAAEYMRGEFEQYAGWIEPGPEPYFDSLSDNYGSDWSLAWHVGVLYQFTPNTRAGITYHSRVNHDLRGAGTLVGPIVGDAPNDEYRSSNFYTDMVAPATTMLSFYHDTLQNFSWEGTLTYTQWGAVNNLRLHNAAGLDPSGAGGYVPGSIIVTVPQHFRNTWNIAVGGGYKLSEEWKLKYGAGFDQSAVNTEYRNVQLPDSDKAAIATGLHYQPMKNIGLDAGWTHIFLRRANIDNVQPIGAETITTEGNVRSSANVIGLQMEYSFN